MDIIIVTDFDNYFPKPMSEYPQTFIESFFLDVINTCISEQESIENIIIRLYGGWYQGNVYSQKASELQVKLQPINFFPILRNGSRINGCVEMAEQQYGIEQIWYNTYQEKRGIQKVKIDWTQTGNGCTRSSSNCPVKVLHNFIKTRSHHCPTTSCRIIQEDVFIRREQKMVDTMMTCDIITYCAEENVGAIYVISDDIDLFPALAISKTKNPDKVVTVMMKNANLLTQYQTILSPFNINVKLVTL